ncbi:hypothetical protein FALBO_16227, partial [Fusarium albosuccineum]
MVHGSATRASGCRVATSRAKQLCVTAFVYVEERLLWLDHARSLGHSHSDDRNFGLMRAYKRADKGDQVGETVAN